MSPVDNDPHFIIHVPQKEDTLCFNINEEPGVVLSLVQDPNTGMVVSHPLPDRAGPGPLCPQRSATDRTTAWTSTSYTLCTWLASACLFLTPSTCLGPVQGLFHGWVIREGAQDSMVRRAPGSI